MTILVGKGMWCYGCEEEVMELTECGGCGWRRCDDCLAEHDEMGCPDPQEWDRDEW